MTAGDTLGEPVVETDSDCDDDVVELGVADSAPVDETCADADTLTSALADGDASGDADRLGDALAVVENDAQTVTLPPGDVDGDVDAEDDTDAEAHAVPVVVGEAAPVSDKSGDTEGLAEFDVDVEGSGL